MKLLKSNKGMSMVEVIIAFAIFMLSLAMVTTALQYSLSTQAKYVDRRAWINNVLNNMYAEKSKENVVGYTSANTDFTFIKTTAGSFPNSFNVTARKYKWYITNADGTQIKYSEAEDDNVYIPIYKIKQG